MLEKKETSTLQTQQTAETSQTAQKTKTSETTKISSSDDNRKDLTVTTKISLDYARRVMEAGLDLFRTVMAEVGDDDLHYYPIGNSGHYVVLNTLDACLIAYAYKEPVQSQVDRHESAFLMQKDPNSYGMRYFQKQKDAIASYRDRFSREKFMNKAVAAVTEDPDLIRPAAEHLHFKFLYEGTDGKYHEHLQKEVN